MWTARSILKDLVTPEQRRAVLTSFWKYSDQHTRLLAQTQLARSLHFRDETIRKMPAEKKADLLASRIGVPEFDQFLEMGLMLYHTHDRSEMLAAFLDEWKIPHENGSIEVDDYPTPSGEQVRAAVETLAGRYDRADMRLYLAAAGLLMAGDWRDATWPVVEELRA